MLYQQVMDPEPHSEKTKIKFLLIGADNLQMTQPT